MDGFGGYDPFEEAFGRDFQQVTTTNPQQSQQQQQQQQQSQSGGGYNRSQAIPGPLMDNYDPLAAFFAADSSANTGTATTAQHQQLLQPLNAANFDPLLSVNVSSPNHNSTMRNQHPHATATNYNNSNFNPTTHAYASQLAAVARRERAPQQNSIMMAQLASIPYGAGQPGYSSPHHHQQQRRHHHHSSSSGNKRSRPQAVSSSSLSNSASNPIVISSPPKKPDPEWLKDLELDVKGISLEPMKGPEVMQRLEEKLRHVITRYLPCVDFLVACQQELRKALITATQKRYGGGRASMMNPQQFFQAYIAPLPDKFVRKYKHIMEQEHLDAARQELVTLMQSSKAVMAQGSEAMKNKFLGGMSDGQSWGLRKWLSKHGGALHICNECECILQACQALDRSLDTTKKLAERIRPTAQVALKRLRADIPASYQEISTAHPYLPFFHRLETALKHLSDFDPEDDDVICIDDDDEIEVLKTKAAEKPKSKSPEKKKKSSTTDSPPPKPTTTNKAPAATVTNDGVDDDNSIIELLNFSPPQQKKRKHTSASSMIDDDDNDSYMKKFFDNFDKDLDDDPIGGAFDRGTSSPSALRLTAFDLALSLGRLAEMFESGEYTSIRPTYMPEEGFWDSPAQYARVLRMFSDLLKSNDAEQFLDPVSEEDPTYADIVKHPLCFREIVAALLEESYDGGSQLNGSNGRLPISASLQNWNMWNGLELLQAIDLVLVNCMAFGKANFDEFRRTQAQKLRREVWAGIKSILNQANISEEERKKYMPTRRGESSGFVITKT